MFRLQQLRPDSGSHDGAGAADHDVPYHFGRVPSESEQWDASPHNVCDVFAAIAWDLARGRRGQWAVGGC